MTITPDGTDHALLRLSRVGLAQIVTGTTDEWWTALSDLPWLTDAGLDWCITQIIRTGPPAGRFHVRPSDIRDLATSRRRTIPHHLQCPDHPDQYAYECSRCPKRITDSTQAIRARDLARQLARQARIDSRTRDRERADALQARADDAARRAAEKLEKKRQLDALHARKDLT